MDQCFRAWGCRGKGGKKRQCCKSPRKFPFMAVKLGHSQHPKTWDFEVLMSLDRGFSLQLCVCFGYCPPPQQQSILGVLLRAIYNYYPTVTEGGQYPRYVVCVLSLSLPLSLSVAPPGYQKSTPWFFCRAQTILHPERRTLCSSYIPRKVLY